MTVKKKKFKIFKDTFTQQTATEWLSKTPCFSKDVSKLFDCLKQDGVVQILLKSKKGAKSDSYRFTQTSIETPNIEENSLEYQLDKQKEKYPQLYVPRYFLYLFGF